MFAPLKKLKDVLPHPLRVFFVKTIIALATLVLWPLAIVLGLLASAAGLLTLISIVLLFSTYITLLAIYTFLRLRIARWLKVYFGVETDCYTGEFNSIKEGVQDKVMEEAIAATYTLEKSIELARRVNSKRPTEVKDIVDLMEKKKKE